MYHKILAAILKELSAGRALANIAKIHSRDRFFSFAHMGRTARYVERALEAAGCRNVEIITGPADGRTPIGDYICNTGWDAEDAILDLIHPGGRRERVADYRKIPQNLVMYSAATPAGGIRTEMVVMDDAIRANKDVGNGAAGKLILTRLSRNKVKPFAVRHKALGIVSSEVWNPDIPDAVFWTNQWSDVAGVWGYTAADTPLVGFNISPRRGEELVALATRGRNRLPVFVRVKTRFHSRAFPAAVTGTIPGKNPDAPEIIFVGHLYEPGAADNAGSCGMFIEQARTLNRLIRSGRPPRPRRTIRFLMGFERLATISYLEKYPRAARKIEACLEMDSMGDDHIKCKTPLGVKLSPQTNPHYLDSLVMELLDNVMLSRRTWFHNWHKIPGYQHWNYNETGLFETSDSSLATQHSGGGAVMIGHANYFWHTSLDTMDMLSASNLHLQGSMTAAAACFIASAGAPEAAYLAQLAASHARRELSVRSRKEMNQLLQRRKLSGEFCRERAEYLAYLRDRLKASVASVRRLVPAVPRRLADMIKRLQRELERDFEQELGKISDLAGPVFPRKFDGERAPLWKSLRKDYGRLAAIVPVWKISTSPLDLARIPDLELRRQVSQSTRAMCRWIDGRRTLLEVLYLSVQERRGYLGDFQPESCPALLRQLRILAEYGYLEL